MNRTKPLAAVCLLLVLLGGSMSLALAHGSGDEVESRQTAVLSEQTDSASVEIVPTEHRVLRDQSVNFAVRVVSDGEDGLLLGFEIGSEGPVSFEFHNPDVRELSIPLVYPDFDAVAYVPEKEVDTEEYVPVTVSPEEKFPRSGSTVVVTRISRGVPGMLTDEFAFEVRCPIECRAELLLQWSVGNLELLVSVLGLLVAFFGRKKLWALLRTPKVRLAGTVGDKRERQSECDRETE